MYTDFRDQNGNPISVATVMEAIKRPVITHEVAFELYHGSSFSPFFFFNEDDIVRGSLVITNSCASDGIKLGSVNIGMLKVTVKNDQLKYLDSPNDLIDCNLSPGYKIKIDDTTTATVMGGTYFVKEVEQLREGIKLTCYDGMSKLDEPFTLGTVTGTPYQILTQATTACNVPLKSTQAEIEALPNGTRTFTLHSDNDCKTWRDVLSYLSMLMGCFVTFARYTYGVLALPGLVVRPFGNGKENPDDTVTDVHRYKGAKFSIFDTEYKAIELTAYAVDGEDTVKKDFTYAETTGVTGQTIKLGYNPFIQADTPEADLTQTQKDILHELLTQVDKYAYTPMQISLPVGFIYDLGDVIKCTGGLANTGFAGGYTEDCYCCISNYTYTYGKEFRIKTLDSKAAKARPIVVPPPTPSDYTVTDAGTLIVELSRNYYGEERIKYLKANDGLAYVAFYTNTDYDCDAPLSVSKDQNAVVHTVLKDDVFDANIASQGSFLFNGDTWYYNGKYHYLHEDLGQKLDGVAQYIGTNSPFVSQEDAARYLLGLVFGVAQAPIMTSDTTPFGRVSASSVFRQNFEAYKAFDGESANIGTMQGGWLATAADSSPWLMYEFAVAGAFQRIAIETANNSATAVREVWIEGSTNGDIWENALASVNSVQLTFQRNEYKQHEFALNGNTYSCLRIRGNQPFYGGIGGYACTFSKVLINR